MSEDTITSKQKKVDWARILQAVLQALVSAITALTVSSCTELYK